MPETTALFYSKNDASNAKGLLSTAKEIRSISGPFKYGPARLNYWVLLIKYGSGRSKAALKSAVRKLGGKLLEKRKAVGGVSV